MLLYMLYKKFVHLSLNFLKKLEILSIVFEEYISV